MYSPNSIELPAYSISIINQRSDELQGIFGHLNQSVFGDPAYPAIESKAAHLLYFVVKNHPFSGGNKRSGAFLFGDFLYRSGLLMNAQGEAVISDTGGLIFVGEIVSDV